MRARATGGRRGEKRRLFPPARPRISRAFRPRRQTADALPPPLDGSRPSVAASGPARADVCDEHELVDASALHIHVHRAYTETGRKKEHEEAGEKHSLPIPRHSAVHPWAGRASRSEGSRTEAPHTGTGGSPLRCTRSQVTARQVMMTLMGRVMVMVLWPA